MTAIEIIDETVAFYSEDPRRRAVESSNSPRCEYYTSDGRTCAVGRCLIEPARIRPGSVSSVMFVEGSGGNTLVSLEDLLKPQYRDHEEDFWINLQNLHDLPDNWDENGITEIGRMKVAELKAKYN